MIYYIGLIKIYQLIVNSAITKSNQSYKELDIGQY